MDTKYAVTALGELLVDFTPCGLSADGRRLFEQNPGGAPANVAAAVARLGAKAAFIGKVGQDMHGAFVKEELEKAGVYTQEGGIPYVQTDPDCFTTLTFVELQENGERSFSFARKPGADTRLRKEELPAGLLERTRIFHFGSLSLTDEPSRSAAVYAAGAAKRAGCIVAYDPNYRALLWRDEEEAAVRLRSVLELVELLKISDEEAQIMTGAADPLEAAKLLAERIPLVAVTMGEKGAYIRNREGGCLAAGFHSCVEDTTGAGDAFWGAFLYRVAESGRRPGQLGLKEAAEFARFANAAASLCVEKRGGIPAMPELCEVKKRLAAAEK